MCGIILEHNFKGDAVNTSVLERFEAQRMRGTQGFGVYDGKELNLVRSTTEDKIKEWVNKYPTDMLLFHHRMPTSTDNVKNACHPFTTRDYFGETQYIFIHNGWLTNAEERRKVHLEMGITYYSDQPDGRFNDSEALMWDIALYIEGRIPKVEASGSAAYILLKRMGDRVDTVYFGRNDGNPLKVDWTEERLLLASTGNGWDAEPGVLYAFDPLGHTLRAGKLEVPRAYRTYTAPATAHDSSWSNNRGRHTYRTRSWHDQDYEPDTYIELKRKYGKKRAKAIMRARRQTNRFLPATTTPEPTHISEMLPAPSHIKNEVKRYLKQAKGSFENAFWLCQYEIDKCNEDLEVSPTDAIIRTELKLAEAVMEVLVTDPEWNTPEAVSSLVRETA